MLSWDVIVLNGYCCSTSTSAAIYCIAAISGKCRQVVLRSVRFIALSGHFDSYGDRVPLRGFGRQTILEFRDCRPRFLASAFTAGPALIILAIQVVRRVTATVPRAVFRSGWKKLSSRRPYRTPSHA